MFQQVGQQQQGPIKTYIVRIKGNISRTRSVRISYDSTIAKHFSVPEKQLVKRNLSQDISFAWSGSEQQFNRLIENWKREYSNFPIDYDYVIEDQSEKYERKQRRNQDEFESEYFDRKLDGYDEYRSYENRIKSRHFQEGYLYGNSERRGYRKRGRIVGYYNSQRNPKFLKNPVNFHSDSLEATVKPIQTIIIKEEEPDYSKPRIQAEEASESGTSQRNESRILKLLKQLKQKKEKKSMLGMQERERSREKKSCFNDMMRRESEVEKRIGFESIGQSDFVNLCRSSDLHKIMDYGRIVEDILSIPHKVIGLKLGHKCGKSTTLSMLYYYLHCALNNEHLPLIPSFFHTTSPQIHSFVVISINLFQLISPSSILARIALTDQYNSHHSTIKTLIHQTVIKSSLKQLHSILITHSYVQKHSPSTSKYQHLFSRLESLNMDECKQVVTIDQISYFLKEFISLLSEYNEERRVVLLMDDYDGPLRKYLVVIDRVVERLEEETKEVFRMGAFVLKEIIEQLLDNVCRNNQYLFKTIITFSQTLFHPHKIYTYSPNTDFTLKQLTTFLQLLSLSLPKQPILNELFFLFQTSTAQPHFPLAHTLIYLTKVSHSNSIHQKIRFADFYNIQEMQTWLKGFEMKFLCQVCEIEERRVNEFEFLKTYMKKEKDMQGLKELLIDFGILVNGQGRKFKNRLAFRVYEDIVVNLYCKNIQLQKKILNVQNYIEKQNQPFQKINKTFLTLLKTFGISQLSNLHTLQLMLAITCKHTHSHIITHSLLVNDPIIIHDPQNTNIYLYSLISQPFPSAITPNLLQKLQDLYPEAKSNIIIYNLAIVSNTATQPVIKEVHQTPLYPFPEISIPSI